MATTLFKKGTIISDDVNLQSISPMEFVLDYFKKRINSKPETLNDRILMIQAKTGSGKSVSIPSELYINFKNDLNNRKILITQPRILTAKEIPSSIVNIPSYKTVFKLGDNLGWLTGRDKFNNRKGLTFMTTGIINNMLSNNDDEEFMKLNRIIIIDEVHERDINIDLSLFLLFSLLKRNIAKVECPFLILMSATFNVDEFHEYFDNSGIILKTEGINYEITDTFLENDVSNYVEYAVNKSLDIHINNTSDFESPYRDIIIFVYGFVDSTKIQQNLNRKLKDKKYNNIPILVVKLDSVIVEEGGRDYRDAIRPITELADMNFNGRKVKPLRRIFISTNVAETGITIDSLKYCIDTGFNRVSEYYPNYNSSALVTKVITRNSALQRRGRVGRKSPGFWYPIYTKEVFDNMIDDRVPEIITRNLNMLLLRIICSLTNAKINDLGEITYKNRFILEQLKLIDMPSIDNIQNNLEQLYRYGLIDNNYNITKLGFTIKHSEIVLEELMTLLAGYIYNVDILALISIIAMGSKITISSLKGIDKIDAELTDYKRHTLFYRLMIQDENIDLLILYQLLTNLIMNDFDNLEKHQSWCKQNNIDFKEFSKALQYRDFLIEKFANMGFNPYKNKQLNLVELLKNNIDEAIVEIKKIKQCLAFGFRMNIAKWNEELASYTTLIKNHPIVVNSYLTHPLETYCVEKSSTCFPPKQTRPHMILYRSLEIVKEQGIFRLVAQQPISVLDGYVDLDMQIYE